MVSDGSAKARRRIGGILAGFAAILAAAAAQAQTPIRFSLDWRWEGPAAPFAVALEKGYFKAEGLEVTIEPATGSRETLNRVATEGFEAGFADVNTLARLRHDKPDTAVKAAMMVYDRAPFAIVGRRSRGITKDLSSLHDKVLGAPQADSAYALWPALKRVNGLDDSGMKFENVGFLVREPMLAQGEVDAVFGYAFTSYINLKSRGVPVEDIVTLPMNEYGLDAYGNAIVVSEKFAKESPEAVKGLLRAILRGLQDTIKDPSAAVDAVLTRNDIAKKEVEVERLKMALEQNVVTPWVKENGLGGIDAARFAKALDQIGWAPDDKDKPKPEDLFTDAFLPPADERKVP